MSVEHMAMVFNAEGLDGTEKLLLLALTNYTDPYGYCWPGEERLAMDTGTSVSTVRRARSKLAKKNLVKSVRRTDRRTGEPITNLTRVNLPLLTSMARPKRAFNDNLMAQISFGDDAVHDASGGGKTRPDLQTVQSDLCQGADCAVVQSNLTGSGAQSDLESIREPAVDPPVIPQSPDARRAGAGSRGSRASGSAASNNSKLRLTKEQKQLVQAVRDLLPSDFNRALPVKTPRNIADEILAALAVDEPRERTPQQLVEHRVLRRWDGYWASKFYAAEIGPAPYGPLLAMVKDTAECGSLSCEDRIDISTGRSCVPCTMRRQDARASREPAAELDDAVVTPSPPVPQPGYEHVEEGGRTRGVNTDLVRKARAAVLQNRGRVPR